MPSDKQALPIFVITVAGAPVSDQFMTDLAEIVVESTLAAPDMVTITVVEDPIKLEYANDATFDLGKEIVVKVKSVGQEAATQLIKAEIVSLEPAMDASGYASFTIRAYDKSNRLRLGKKTRTFLKKKDSDLVATIAGEAGLSPDSDATTTTYDWILQYNQTNMEFLAGRAARIGYQLGTSGDNAKLWFKKPAATSATGPDLTYGENLLQFRPRTSVARQASKAAVYGWDKKGKTAIKSEKPTPVPWSSPGYGKQGPAAETAAFGAAEAAVVDEPVFTVGEANEIAQGTLDDRNAEFIEADAVCEGNAAIKAAAKVTVKNVGSRFGGTYFVTTATHIYTPEEGYTTTFHAAGRHPAAVSALLDPDGPGGSTQRQSGRISGVVTALVTNLMDPENLGRIKVKYAWLGEIESDWAWIAAPMAGPQRGFEFLPEVNDEVLVAFEHGDPHRPYIIGALWSSVDKVPEPNNTAVVGGKVVKRIIKTRKGHQVIFDDTDSAEKITIQTKALHKIILDDTAGAEKITIIDKTNNNKIVIDSVANKVTVDAQMDINLTAKGNMNFAATGNITLDAKGQVSIKSVGNTTVKATAALSLEGLKTDVKGQTMVAVNGGPMTEIKGGIVKIN